MNIIEPLWKNGLTHQAMMQLRRQIAEQADYCVRWLRSQGFEVLSVTYGPRILVRSSPLCDQLEGAVDGYSRSPRGIERYKCVIRHDCEVRWLVPGGAA